MFPFLGTSAISHSQTDTAIGLIEAGKYGNDHLALAAVLTFDQKTERQKANAIYNWVTHNIAYDVEALRKFPKRPDDLAGHTLRTRKAVCDGYAELYTQLCRDAGLQAACVEGYAKDWLFDNGDELYIPRHRWSAVRIAGKWELVDPTWGAGNIYQKRSFFRWLIAKVFHKGKSSPRNLRFRYKYDPQYFAQNPEEFRLRHLPSDPLWQLTDSIMPLQIFEAGDSAVKAFNVCCSKPRQSDPALDKIATYDDRQQLFEMADRAYTYNKRYSTVMALKSTARAESMIEKVLTDTTIQHPDLMVKDANNDLKRSLEFLREQKKSFPTEYNKLKQKNKAKSVEAKQQIRAVRTNDKRIIAQSKKRAKSGEAKSTRTRKKLATVRRRASGLDTSAIRNIESAAARKGGADVSAIRDSIDARSVRIAATTLQLAKDEVVIRDAIVASALLLDTLGKSMVVEDSLLRREAIERMGMHDSYDDEVKHFNRLFKQQKYTVTDTLLDDYFTAYDTIVARMGRLHTARVALLDLHKANVRGYEQYKKRSGSDPQLPGLYAASVTAYSEAIDSTNLSMNLFLSYVAKNRKLFAGLTKMAKRQIRIADYMEQAEKAREQLEAGSVARKKAFDMKENEMQKQTTQRAIKTLQRAIDKMER
jgi:hypothetical protein